MVKIPESIFDTGFVEIIFNGTKLIFEFSMEELIRDRLKVNLVKTRDFGYLISIGYIKEKDQNVNTYRWGVFVTSSQIEKIIIEDGLELRDVYLSDVCGEILIISGWNKCDYKVVFAPLNK